MACIRPAVFNLGYEKTSYGYVQLKKKILFRDKHWGIRARFRVSRRRPERKDIEFGSVIFSLSFILVIDYRLSTARTIHQPLYGYKVEKKLNLGVGEQKLLKSRLY
jgi:hypothetical protein